MHITSIGMAIKELVAFFRFGDISLYCKKENHAPSLLVEPQKLGELRILTDFKLLRL